MRLQRQEGVSEVVGILLLIFTFLFMCLLIWYLYYQSGAIPLVMKETLSVTNIMMILITMIILVAIIFLGFKYFAKKKNKIS
jgi:uncharacterized protein involved in cysteine biosynthesis